VDKTSILCGLLPRKGKQLFEYGHRIFCGQYSRDGSVFMSAGQDHNVRLYDTARWKEIKSIEARHCSWSVIDIDYSPDQRWIIYSSWSNYAHLCNIHGEYEIHDDLNFRPHSLRFCLFGIKFSPDSGTILGGANDGYLYVYDLDRKERTLKVAAHEDDVNTVCFLDDGGQIFASGSDDNLCKVWDRRMLGESNPKPVGVLIGHTAGITHVSSKGDGRYLLSNSKDQSIKLWDLRKMHDGSKKIPKAPRYSRWDDPTQHPHDKSLMTYRGHAVYQTLIRAYFSPAHSTGQKYIYSGSHDGAVYIYDVLTGGLVSKIRGHRSVIRDLSWHPFEPELITTSWDSTISRWQPRID